MEQVKLSGAKRKIAAPKIEKKSAEKQQTFIVPKRKACRTLNTECKASPLNDGESKKADLPKKKGMFRKTSEPIKVERISRNGSVLKAPLHIRSSSNVRQSKIPVQVDSELIKAKTRFKSIEGSKDVSKIPAKPKHMDSSSLQFPSELSCIEPASGTPLEITFGASGDSVNMSQVAQPATKGPVVMSTPLITLERPRTKSRNNVTLLSAVPLQSTKTNLKVVGGKLVPSFAEPEERRLSCFIEEELLDENPQTVIDMLDANMSSVQNSYFHSDLEFLKHSYFSSIDLESNEYDYSPGLLNGYISTRQLKSKEHPLKVLNREHLTPPRSHRISLLGSPRRNSVYAQLPPNCDLMSFSPDIK